MATPPKSGKDFNWDEIWQNQDPSGAALPPKDFQWGRLAPGETNAQQKADLARQIRIMLAAGKKSSEIGSWLQQTGLPPDQVAALRAEIEAGHSDWWQWFCSRTSLVLIALLSVAVVVLVLVRRPWDAGRWTWTLGAGQIEAGAGFLYFCFLYFAAMTLMWYAATRFGAWLDRMHDRRRRHP
jgi:hypothetical protein